MKINEIEALVRPNIRALCPYSTARDEFKGSLGVFLDANESPFDTGFNRYPDPRQSALKERLSAIKCIPAGNIFVGNGSDEAIDLVYRIFCEPGKDSSVIISPSYGMYSVCADINGVAYRSVQLEEDFSLDTGKLLAACDPTTKVIFLCSPNNPTANVFPTEQILDIVDRFPGMVVLDEAYADFSSAGSLRRYIFDHPNLIVLQTLSKAWGLAGLRLGLAFSNEYVMRLFAMVKYPYNVNALSQQAALKALGQDVRVKIEETLKQRAVLAGELESSACVRKVYPSEANFLLVEFDDPDAVYAHLVSDGVIVRNRNKVKGCSGCLRITVGLASENEALMKSLKRYEESNIR